MFVSTDTPAKPLQSFSAVNCGGFKFVSLKRLAVLDDHNPFPEVRSVFLANNLPQNAAYCLVIDGHHFWSIIIP